MSTKRLVIDGFGQIELNNAAFRRDGRIEAQCVLDATSFSEGYAENGMLVCVDKANKKIVKYTTNTKLPLAVIYSSEHLYDDRAPGLKNFKNEIGSFLPRLGYLSVGDSFTENCVCYNDSEFDSDEALITALKAAGTTPVYGGVSTNGAINLSATAPTAGPVLAAMYATMPDGQDAVKFHVLSV